MSSKHFVKDINEATRGYDTATNQYVMIEEIISNSFCICQPYDRSDYIICKIDDLTELHYM